MEPKPEEAVELLTKALKIIDLPEEEMMKEAKKLFNEDQYKLFEAYLKMFADEKGK